MKRSLIVVLIVLLLLVAIPGGIYWILVRPIPGLDGTEAVAGLEHGVSVTFDGHAVPYIEARSDSDAYVAQGYITARDRMFQMDILRRLATGYMAEIFGASWLPTDRLMRTLGIRKLAFAEYDRLSPAAKAALESYARGVNSYISDYNGRLPLEFGFLSYAPRTWRPEDSLAILKYQAYKLDESWRLDDFRQRVSNVAGEKLAAQLFQDDLVAYGLPPAPGQKPDDEKSGEKGAAKSGEKNGAKPGDNGTTKSGAKSGTKSGKASSAGGAGDAPTSAGHARSAGHAPTSSTEERQPAPAPAPTRAPESELAPAPAPAPGGPRTYHPTPTDRLLAQLAAEADRAHPFSSNSTMGSVTWAVPAAASATRGAMLACTKDNTFSSPSDWYICSLNSPGLHVAGGTIPGVPGIMLGRNENVSWGSSALKADVEDIYLEQFKSQFDTAYRTANGWQQAEVQTDVIPVRWGKDVEHKVFLTKHGPVLLRNNESAVSLAWTGSNTDSPTFEALYRMNRVTKIDEFVDALSKYADPPMMFVFADRWGNIGCHAAGTIPVRSGGGTGTMLNAGWEQKGTWQSMVPFDKLPQGIITYSTSGNADRTPIVAANQKPASAGSALPKMDGGIMLGHQWAPPYRANRLLSALSNAKRPVNLADMISLLGDQYSELAPVMATALQKSAANSQLVDRNSLYAVKLLNNWDGQLTASGTEGSLYESFLQTLSRRIIEPYMGTDMATEYMRRWPCWTTLVHSVIQNQPMQWLSPEERTYDTFFATTLTQALKSLRITFDTTSPASWTWGKIHQATFQQPAASSTWFGSMYKLGPLPIGGAPECINSCDVTFDPHALQFNSESGPTQRMIIDMSDRDKFYQSTGTGQSGHLMSSYRDDQLKAWSTVDLIPIAFSPDQLMKQAKHRLNLEGE